MEEGEVRRQIRLFRKGGVGGFFIHAREGLRTQYMGEQWMRCVKAAVEEAKKNGLQVWLYDEDRWPAGTAAGEVCRIGQDAFRLKGLTLEVCRESCKIPKEERLLAAYAAKIDADAPMEIHGFRRLSPEKEPELEADETLLLARVEISGKSEWFHEDAPADMLNPEAAACFIRETHERYKEAVGEEFGNTVRGIFTDEPSLADRRAAFTPDRGWMPWTFGMERIFAEKKGYDILDYVPELYFSISEGLRESAGMETQRIRHDYWRTVGERFCESYTKQISAWCEKNGIAFTGHFLQEDRLGLCTRVNGAVMPHYRYLHVPGIDWLGEQTEEFLTVKQCSSVAAQLGKKQSLTETYAGTGWDFTFEGQKWLGDFQYVLGINRRCLHLAFYSLEGMRKRDFPPSFHYNNGWWEQNGTVEDYFARLSLLLTQGEAVRDLLVLHPASTAWSLLGTSPYGNPVRRHERDVPMLDAFGDRFQLLLKELCGEHYDFDLGDEGILAEYGAVDGSFLNVGQARYRTVLVPPMETMLETTRRLLWEFAAKGGSVICMEPRPARVEGVRFNDRLFPSSGCAAAGSMEDMLRLLEELLPRRVSVEAQGKQAKQVLYQLRRTGDGYLLFLVNNDRNQGAQVRVTLSSEITGTVQQWELLAGEIRKASGVSVEDGGRLSFETCLQEADSRMYYIRKTAVFPEEKEEAAGDITKEMDLKRLVVLGEEVQITCSEDNLLVLDRCKWRLAGEEWQPETEVWAAQKKLRERLKMRSTWLNGGAQWYCWAEETCDTDGTEVELEFCFEAERVPEKIALLLERPEQFTLYLNGAEISSQTEGFFLDRAFQRLACPGVRKGINYLRMKCAYTNRMELEACYLSGFFGVSEDRRLTAMPKILKQGDWTKQGLPHYCGQVTYHYRCELSGKSPLVLFRMGGFAAVGADLTINGKRYAIPWKCAREADVTEAVREGENRIDVTLYGTPRNMLGPFVHRGESRAVVNSAAFQKEKEKNRYDLTSYGIMTPCELWG